MGFPTANIDAAAIDIPDGVYASTVEVDGKSYRAMSNIGVRPSVDGRQRLLETCLFGFDGDLYGRRLSVRLDKRIRDERKFGSIEELRAQIESDAETIRNL